MKAYYSIFPRYKADWRELSGKMGVGYREENRSEPMLTRGTERSHFHSVIYLDWETFLSNRPFLGLLYKLEQIVEILKEIDKTTKFKLFQRTNWLLGEIDKALKRSEIDLGIRFDKGKGIFYPSGDKKLDEKLVKEPLQNLEDAGYVGTSKTWKQGLRTLLEAQKDSDKLDGVVFNVYKALEAFAKIVCKNEKEFSKNREEFLKTLGFSKNEFYKRMLKEYCDYAHAFRHGKKEGERKPRPPLDYAEVEAFVYLTGLFIRLGIQKLKKK